MPYFFMTGADNNAFAMRSLMFTGNRGGQISVKCNGVDLHLGVISANPTYGSEPYSPGGIT